VGVVQDSLVPHGRVFIVMMYRVVQVLFKSLLVLDGQRGVPTEGKEKGLAWTKKIRDILLMR